MLSYDSQMSAQNPNSGAHMASQIKAAAATPTTATPAAAVVNGSTPSTTSHGTQHHHIWLVTGPAGCGKTTVAEHLANSLDMPYIEGDAFHTAANVEKMRTGTPLNDADRWDWLTALREESMRRITGGACGVVVTCSALKRKYRDVIRVAAYYDHDLLIHFIYLDADEEVLLQRVTARQGHYMGAGMVHSQFADLERPSADEKDVISVDVSRSLDDVQRDALARASEIMTNDRPES